MPWRQSGVILGSKNISDPSECELGQNWSSNKCSSPSEEDKRRSRHHHQKRGGEEAERRGQMWTKVWIFSLNILGGRCTKLFECWCKALNRLDTCNRRQRKRERWKQEQGPLSKCKERERESWDPKANAFDPEKESLFCLMWLIEWLRSSPATAEED